MRALTLTRDKHLQTGLVGSLLIHTAALLLIVLVAESTVSKGLQPVVEPPPKPEPEVTMIFPEQVLVPPPPLVKPPPPPPKAYIRTSQNEEAAAAPKGALFQSDRNTVAASEKAPSPNATLPMPSMDGAAPSKFELAERDYKDGKPMDDSAPAAVAVAVAPQPPTPPRPQTPAAPTPPSPPSPPPPLAMKTPDEPPPAQVAKAEPAQSPLAKMMEDMDKQAAKQPGDRLPIEVRKPQPEEETPAPKPAMRAPDAAPPAKETPPKPQVREPQDLPPVPKAIPVQTLDPLKRNTPRPDKDAMTPFTRQGKVDGNVDRRGANAVDSEATPLGIYMKKVTGAVEKKWHAYVRLRRDSVTFGRVRFRFYVNRRGIPEDLQILSDARDADPRMREMTLRAILDAEIPPIPADLLAELDEDRVKIEYEAIIY